MPYAETIQSRLPRDKSNPLYLLLLALMSLVIVAPPLSASAPQDESADQAEEAAPADEVAQALASPRATLEAFLRAMPDATLGVDEAWQRILATLHPDAAEQIEPESLRRRAEQLYGAIRRLRDIPGGHVPDAVAVEQEGHQRYLLLSPDTTRYTWIWDQLGHGPEGRIELMRDEAGTWRFSRETIEQVPQLYASIRNLPPGDAAVQVDANGSNGSAPDEPGMGEVGSMLANTLEHTSLWHWLAMVVFIFLGLLAGKLAQMGVRSVAARLRDKHWEFRGTIFEDAANPLNLVLITLGLTVGLRFIHLEPPLASLSWEITRFLLTISIAWFLFNLVDLVDLGLRRATAGRDGTMEKMVVPLIRKTLRVFLVIMFALVIADTFFGVNVTAWIAGLGIAGLAVSLAAQDSIKNLFGSLTVLTDRPFAVGDMVTFSGSTGIIEEIGFRSTKLRLFTGAVVTIPNMKFIDNAVENISRRESIRRNMNITVTYDTPPEKLEQALQTLRDIMAEEEVAAPFNLDERPPRIYFSEFNADSLNLLVIYWYFLDESKGHDWWGYNAHAQMLNMKVLRAFNDAGIDFAFPTQTLYLAGDPDRQLTVHVQGDGSLSGPHPSPPDGGRTTALPPKND